MTKLIKEKPSTFEEAIEHREWKDSMNEEYQSIMESRRSYLARRQIYGYFQVDL